MLPRESIMTSRVQAWKGDGKKAGDDLRGKPWPSRRATNGAMLEGIPANLDALWVSVNAEHGKVIICPDVP